MGAIETEILEEQRIAKGQLKSSNWEQRELGYQMHAGHRGHIITFFYSQTQTQNRDCSVGPTQMQGMTSPA